MLFNAPLFRTPFVRTSFFRAALRKMFGLRR
jgi:hypothetical protein